MIGAPAYGAFCEGGGLRARIASELEGLQVDDTAALAERSASVRGMIRAELLRSWLEGEIRVAYEELTEGEEGVAVAVRSSATAEDPAVADYLRQLIPRARRLGLQTSICGQAPSVYPEYAELLVSCGIDAISVNIDVVDCTRRLVAAAETRLLLDAALARRETS